MKGGGNWKRRLGLDGGGEDRVRDDGVYYIGRVGQFYEFRESRSGLTRACWFFDRSISLYLRGLHELLNAGFMIRFGGVCCLFRDIEMLFSGSVRVPFGVGGGLVALEG